MFWKIPFDIFEEELPGKYEIRKPSFNEKLNQILLDYYWEFDFNDVLSWVTRVGLSKARKKIKIYDKPWFMIPDHSYEKWVRTHHVQFFVNYLISYKKEEEE